MGPQTITLPKSILYRVEFVIYGLAFAVPLFVAGPQLLTGTIVNYLLFIYALLFPKKNFIPIAVLPSIAALSHGILFGSYTPFLLYFLPFIWLGNIVLIKIVMSLDKKVPLSFALLISSIAKVFVLFFAATFYFQLQIVPQIFLTAMGILQLYTALAGGIMAIITFHVIKKQYE